VQNLGTRLKTVPGLGALLQFADARPRLAAWIVLSVCIVALLLVEARDVGLLIGQWIALIVASVLVAGLCIWIVSWEDSDEEATDATLPTKAKNDESTPPSAA
jgi:K+ transporter